MPGTRAVGICLSPSSPCSGPSGCILMQLMAGFSSLSRRVTPMKVPLVPRPVTKWVMRPSVCRQISMAVVS